ncbi:MAG: hypothetical protein QM704_25415 [Anaeromyxobacteraceae bacterium]
MAEPKLLRVDSLDPNVERAQARRRRQRGVSAWIAQWVTPDVADHPLELANPSVRSGVVLVASSRAAEDKVCESARAIYLAQLAEPSFILEVYRLEHAPRPRRGPSPVTAIYAMLEAKIAGERRRAPFVGRFRFGRDPCLYVRRVKNLRERQDGSLDWDEIPIPPVPGDPSE